MEHNTLLIVGIDPGTTLGYAVLDIEGSLVEIHSAKDFSFARLVERIIALGKPIIIATDKAKIPSFVERCATKLGARLLSPSEDLKVEEKRELTKWCKFRNYHQMDALASALFAFKKIGPLLMKIDLFTERNQLEHLKENLKELVLLREMSIAAAVSLLEKPEQEDTKIIKRVIEQRRLDEKDFLTLFNKCKRLERDIILLKQQNMKLDKQLKRAPQKIEKIQDERLKIQLRFKEDRIYRLGKTIENKRLELTALERENQLLINFLSNTSANYLLKKLPNLGHDVEQLNRVLQIQRGDILLVEDANIVSNATIALLREKVSMVIYKKPISEKLSEDLPFVFVPADSLTIEENGLFALVNKKELEEKKKQLNILQKIVEDYRKEGLLRNSK